MSLQYCSEKVANYTDKEWLLYTQPDGRLQGEALFMISVARRPRQASFA